MPLFHSIVNGKVTSSYTDDALPPLFQCMVCHRMTSSLREGISFVLCPGCQGGACRSCSEAVLKDAKVLQCFANTWNDTILTSCPRCSVCLRITTFVNEHSWSTCSRAEGELLARSSKVVDYWVQKESEEHE